MKGLFKKIIMIVLALLAVVTVACKQEEIAIKITASETTVQKGDVIDFTVEVTGTENKGYSWNISDMSIISVDVSLKGTVLKNVKEKTEVTITVISNADSSKTDTVVITVEPYGNGSVVVPTMKLSADKTTVVKDDIITFTVEVENSEDKAYTLSSSNTEYVTIENNTAKVVKEPTTLDQAITITATLTSNPLDFTTK